MAKAKDEKLSFAEKRARDVQELLQDVIAAGGSVNIRFDSERGARVRVNLDRVANQSATALYLRYRHAPEKQLLSAARGLLLENIGEGPD